MNWIGPEWHRVVKKMTETRSMMSSSIAAAEPENLGAIWHEVHSNKCESLNGFITEFLPKDIDRARTYLVIGINGGAVETTIARPIVSLRGFSN
jgi:hypothetical protein